ncbi:MAG: hypothetical protein GY853_13875 [PVC group bacterium]|nr:hypothetical protein [PVC group bacterium]
MPSARRSVRITDDWMGANKTGTFNVAPLPKGGRVSHNKENFIPQFVLISRATGGGNYAEIDGVLFGENETDYRVYRLAVGVIHEIGFRAIRIQNTSGREITIFE